MHQALRIISKPGLHPQELVFYEPLQVSIIQDIIKIGL